MCKGGSLLSCSVDEVDGGNAVDQVMIVEVGGSSHDGGGSYKSWSTYYLSLLILTTAYI